MRKQINAILEEKTSDANKELMKFLKDIFSDYGLGQMKVKTDKGYRFENKSSDSSLYVGFNLTDSDWNASKRDAFIRDVIRKLSSSGYRCEITKPITNYYDTMLYISNSYSLGAGRSYSRKL